MYEKNSAHITQEVYVCLEKINSLIKCVYGGDTAMERRIKGEKEI